jgi:hypothetical protein
MSSAPSLSQKSPPSGVLGEQNPAMKERISDAVLILDEYLGISYYNQEFSYLNQLMNEITSEKISCNVSSG